MKYLKNKIIKNKILLLTTLATIIIIVCSYVFIIRKTEAPVIDISENITKGEVFQNQSKVEPVAPKDNPPIEKYKILSRSVVVPENPKNKNKIVLLTIDDGPSARTIEMMDVLDKHNAKAIFFINGMHNKGYPGIIKKTSERGFAVGNHTWSHLNLKKEKDENISHREILKNSNLIESETGQKPRFFRAPYGESNPAIRNFVKDNGMIFMDWSGATMDWNKSTEEKDIFVGNVMKTLHSGSIILIHEHPWSLANLDALLTKMESDGYTYVDPNDIVE